MKWRNLRRRAEPTEKAATGRTKPSPPNRMRRREGDGGTHGTGRARRVCAALRAGRRLESPWRGRLRLHPRWPSRQVMGEPLRRGRRCADAICHHRYWGTASCRGGRSLRRLAGCGAGKEMGERTARSGATRLCGPSGRAQIGIALARAAAASPASAFPSGHGRTDRQGDVFCCRATLATIAPRHAAKRRPALPFTRGYLFFQRAMAARNSSP